MHPVPSPEPGQQPGPPLLDPLQAQALRARRTGRTRRVLASRQHPQGFPRATDHRIPGEQHEEPSDDLSDPDAPDPVAGPSRQPAGRSSSPPWPLLDQVDVYATFHVRVSTLKTIPTSLRGPIRAVLKWCLEAIVSSSGRGEQAEAQAWALWCLLPRLILRGRSPSSAGPSDLSQRQLISERLINFWAGEWDILFHDAQIVYRGQAQPAPAARPQGVAASPAAAPVVDARLGDHVTELVRQGSVSRAAQLLTSPGLAPRTPATLQVLTDPARRPPTSEEPLPPFREFPRVELDRAHLVRNIRSIPRGTAPGLSALRGEHLRLLLEDPTEESVHAFHAVAERLANAEVPPPVRAAIALGGLTALNKLDEAGNAVGVRGIVAGDQTRRVVSRTLAQVHQAEVEAATAPQQLAVGTRVGSEAAIHAARVKLEADPDMVLLSLDGIGAYDHIRRAAMFRRLDELEHARAIIPFLLLFYGGPSTYLFESTRGAAHEVAQGEGGEQGDALMPELFALGLDHALKEIQTMLLPEELCFAFLDDVYLIVRRDRARELFDRSTQCIEARTGIRTHLGKLRVWGSGDPEPPPGIAELGAEIWRGNRAPEEAGVVVLGAPIGRREFVFTWCANRHSRTQTLLDRLPAVVDVQARWLILKFSAEPRVNHVLRTVPPELALPLATRHDDAIWQAILALLDSHPAQVHAVAKWIAVTPLSDGGLGLRLAVRIREAAHWASWADALPLICGRFPVLGAQIQGHLDRLAAQQGPPQWPVLVPPGVEGAWAPGPSEGSPPSRSGGGVSLDSLAAGAPGVAAAPVPPCLLAVAGAVRTLSTVGYVCPSWRSILDGARPGAALPGAAQDGAEVEPGRWIQGWQRTAAKVVETAAADLLRGQLSHPMCARLRSQGGVGAGMWLQVFPTDPALWFESALFQTALRLRLMQPLPLSVVSCTCGAHLDPWGIHLQACMQTGRVSRRAVLQEQALWQVLRETGATARHRPFLRDLSVPGVLGTDARRLDVVASGLPVYGGRTLVIDATLRSPLTGAGHVRFDAHLTDGATFTQARLDKEHKYPELASQGSRLKFLVAAAEVGGRYNDEVVDLVRQLVAHRASLFAPCLRQSMRVILARRYWGILSVATQRAVAFCVASPLTTHTAAVFPLPDFETLVTSTEAPEVSRMA